LIKTVINTANRNAITRDRKLSIKGRNLSMGKRPSEKGRRMEEIKQKSCSHK
jgi:hypothetical protein